MKLSELKKSKPRLTASIVKQLQQELLAHLKTLDVDMQRYVDEGQALGDAVDLVKKKMKLDDSQAWWEDFVEEVDEKVVEPVLDNFPELSGS